MYYVYILLSEIRPSKSYIGFTSKTPLDRLSEHNLGLSQFTKTYKPWKLIYYETFYCEECAKHREIFFKSGFGFRLRKLLQENYK